MALTILKNLKRDQSIKMMIHRRLAGWEEAREHGVVHASDLMKELEFCPREWAFLDLGLCSKKDNFVGTALRITFDHGRSVEYNIRNNYLRDVMSGYWRCKVCGTRHPTFGKAPKVTCGKCNWGKGPLWEYDEVSFVSPHSGISGGIDGLVDVGDSKLRILEIKTVDKDEFRKLEAPLAEHRFRTALYLRLVEESEVPESNRINPTSASILYVSKSFGFKDESMREEGIKDAPFSPFKEFTVTRQDTLVESSVAKARVLHHWRTTQQGMPCGVCSNGLTKRAQQCAAIGPCWSGAYPSTLTWPDGMKVKHPGKEVVQ